MPSETDNTVKKGKRRAKRIAIVIFMLLGGIFVLGSGASFYAWLTSVKDTTPEAVIRRAKEITEIDIPDYFHPKEGISVGMFFTEKKVAVFETEDVNGVKGELALIGVTGMMATGDKKMYRWFPSMRLYTEIYQNIDVESTSHKTIRVRNEDVDFLFRTGTHRGTGTPFRMVEGIFRSRVGGFSRVSLHLPEKLYNEEEIVNMLRSIR